MKCVLGAGAEGGGDGRDVAMAKKEKCVGANDFLFLGCVLGVRCGCVGCVMSVCLEED